MLARLYAEQGKSDQALALLSEMEKSSRAHPPKDSLELAKSLTRACHTLLRLKEWDRAESMIREVLAIREVKDPDYWKTFNVKSMLGGVLLGRMKYAEAEPLLLAGYEGMKQREGSISPMDSFEYVREALEHIVELYTAWHAAEPGKGYYAKAAEWRQKLEWAYANPQ